MPEELHHELEQLGSVLPAPPAPLPPLSNPVSEPGAFLEDVLAEARLCNK